MEKQGTQSFMVVLGRKSLHFGPSQSEVAEKAVEVRSIHNGEVVSIRHVSERMARRIWATARAQGYRKLTHTIPPPSVR
jgi:hypothetical protein